MAHACGGNGECHTLVLDGPAFKMKTKSREAIRFKRILFPERLCVFIAEKIVIFEPSCSPSHLPDLSQHIGEALGTVCRGEECVLYSQHALVRIDYLGLDGDGHVALHGMIQRPDHRVLIQL
jgi:hypothetical protein